MRVLIADDEPLARMRLRTLIESLDGYEVAGEAADGREVLLRFGALAPEIVLLDIRMPGMDGLEAARHLSRLEHAPAVIFTTAYSDHALEAFAAHALDYLLKPIRREHLEQALTRIRGLTHRPAAAPPAQDLDQARKYLCVRVRGSLQLVAITDIVYFLADEGYVTVHHTHGEVLIEDSLKSLEQEFGDRFTRIHRNALVANACLQALEKDSDGQFRLRLHGLPSTLEVSRRQVPLLRRHLRRQ